jgi:uncharacterized protein YifN (PemK superfamily)
MKLPNPEVGLVFPYYYLWRREHERGEESGRKSRPCILIVVAAIAKGNRQTVIAVPVTTQKPDSTRSYVEIPDRVRRHLGLNAPQCWVICDEYNQFDWPSPDLSTTTSGNRSFGNIPTALIQMIRNEVQAAMKRGRLKKVPRTE